MNIAVVLSLIATVLAILYIGASVYYFYGVRNGLVVYGADLSFMFWGGLLLLLLLLALMIGSLVSLVVGSDPENTKTTVVTSGTQDPLLIPEP